METLKHDFKGALLKEDILSQIKLDILKIGNLVLPEKKLAERYKISYLTVRNVISELEKDGILKRHKGKGTFVVGHPSAKKKTVSIQIILSNPSILEREGNPITWFVSMDIVKGILDCCSEYGLQPELLYYKGEKISLTKPAIIINAISCSDRRTLEENNVPYVLVNQPDINSPAHRIICDDYFGTYQSTVYLIKTGHKKIAYLGPKLEHLHFMPRYNGFIAGLSEYGLKPADIIIENTGEILNTCSAVMQFFKDKELPEAIVCATDLRAIGAMDGLKKNGVKVPDDVGIVGFDDIAEAALTDPPLTTVAKPRKEMGYQAVKFILDWDENLKNKIFTKMLKPELIIRESAKNRAGREEKCTKQKGVEKAGALP